MPAELGPDDLISLNRLTTVARIVVGTSHALNNALQVIAGSAELLMQQRDLSDATRRAVDRIQQQTSRAAETLNELMQCARDQPALPGQVSLRSVAAQAVGLRSFSIRRAGLTLSFDAAAAAPGIVRGLSGQLLQLVLNLIMNAEQALRGTSGGSIELTVTESSDTVTLTVVDNGPGVAPGVTDSLFDAFTTTHLAPDTHGLGLAAARAIARQHGGDLVIDSSAPGCRATLSLPKVG
jgi:signal transduction histidine kinase